MYKTPIKSAIERYIAQNNLRLHTPGHVGKNLLNFKGFEQLLPYDITEISGLESLFECRGAIYESEQIAAEILSANYVIYSASGSTHLIHAALSVVRVNGGKVIFIGNIHKAAVNACILFDIMPIFADFSEIESLLADDIGAVFITNPSYYGEIFDVSEVASLCKSHRIPLIIDAAHGAHLQFIHDDFNVFRQGASVVINSAHKTLPALTGGAWAQIFDDRFAPQICKSHMALTASTSPSYPVLLSLELTLNRLAGKGADELKSQALRAIELKKSIAAMGFSPQNSNCDPLRLTVSALNFGYTGFELQNYLQACEIVAEMADFQFVILLLHPNLTADDFEKIKSAFNKISQKYFGVKNDKNGAKTENLQHFYTIFAPKMVISPRGAHFALQEKISVENALNRIAAEITGHTPPGVPLTIPGSEICENTIKMLKNYGIFEILVVK